MSELRVPRPSSRILMYLTIISILVMALRYFDIIKIDALTLISIVFIVVILFVIIISFGDSINERKMNIDITNIRKINYIIRWGNNNFKITNDEYGTFRKLLKLLPACKYGYNIDIKNSCLNIYTCKYIIDKGAIEVILDITIYKNNNIVIKYFDKQMQCSIHEFNKIIDKILTSREFSYYENIFI